MEVVHICSHRESGLDEDNEFVSRTRHSSAASTNKTKQVSGYTLLELMIVVVILGILTMIAVPNFVKLVRTNRIVSEANSLLTILTLTRSEAIKRSTSVTLCKSSDGTTCSTGSGVNWNQGIIMFVDTNSNGAIDTGEVVIRVDVPFSTSNTLTLSGGNSGNTFVFQANGAPPTSQTGTFTITSSTTTKTIVVGAAGRSRIQ